MANSYDERDDEFFDRYGDDLLEEEKIDRVLDEIADIKQTIQGLPRGEERDSSYDEVTKLRDEVKFTKTTQKLKEEIRRLSNRINDLRDERGTDIQADGELRESLERLTALGEELIRRSRESDRKYSDEIALIKKQIYKLAPAADITGALTAIKNGVKNSEDFIVGVKDAVDKLAPAKKTEETDVGAEILRQFYEIKKLLGSPSPLAEKRNDELLELYDALSKVKYDVKLKSLSVAEKFASVDALAKRLYDTNEYDVEPIATALNGIINDLCSLPLDRATAEAILGFSGEVFSIPNSKREAVRAYLDSVSALVRDGSVENMDDLPDVIALKNDIQNNRNEFECEREYSEILNTNIALLSEKDVVRQKTLRVQLKNQIKRLTSLEVRDLVSYPLVTLVKPYRATKRGEGEGLFARLGELKNLLLDANLAQSGGVVTPPATGGIISEISNLKNEIYNLNNIDNVSQAILDLKSDCLTILEKLEENKDGDESGILAGVPTINEIVAQLDRLFDDFKNVTAESENNILGSLEVVGEAIARLAAENERSTDAASSDRRKLIEDVAYIRSAIESGAVITDASEAEPEIAVAESERDILVEEPMESFAETTEETVETAETDKVVASESGNEELLLRLAEIEKNQQRIFEEIEKNRQSAFEEIEKNRQSAFEAIENNHQRVIGEIEGLIGEIANNQQIVSDVIDVSQQTILDRIDSIAAKPVTLPVYDHDDSAAVAALGAVSELAARVERLESKFRDDEIVAEIKLLRDQLFAVSMASVSDGETSTYESYNNLILNEIYDLDEKLDGYADTIASARDEESEKLREELSSLKSELTGALSAGADSDAIIKELNKIKEDFRKHPAPPPAPAKPTPPPAPAKRKKKVTPMINKDLSINELLLKISETDIIIDED